MKIPNNVLEFAGSGDNLKTYRQFVDLFRHKQYIDGKENVEFSKYDKDGNEISYDEKESQMNATFKREILRVSGIQSFEEFPVATWSTHPTLRWATFAVVSAMIDMVLPDSLIDTIGMYSEVRNIGWGDSAAFDIKPRDLFVVSKAGRSKRTTELHKQFDGQITILPELREMTVFVSLQKVLAGKESLAEFVMKMIRSFEVQLSYDVYDAFKTAMDNVDSTASTGLQVTGYTESDFVRLSQTVRAWNGGVRPLAIGTQLALANIIPSNANYRYDINSEFVQLGYIRNFKGTDIMVIPQVADWTTPFGLKLDDDRVWIISPSSQKLIKVVLEGNTLANSQGSFENANLTQTSTIMKSWGTGLATNQVAALIKLS